MNIFFKAARLIERKGWARGQFEKRDGSLCLLGALGRAEVGYTYRNAEGKRERLRCGGGPSAHVALFLTDVIAEQHPGCQSILAFNDSVAFGCDQDEAVRLLEKAGAKWDETH